MGKGITREYQEVFKILDAWIQKEFKDGDTPLTDIVMAIDDVYEARDKKECKKCGCYLACPAENTHSEIPGIEEVHEKKRKSIKIPFSEEDLSELLNGETFDWTFDNVDVHLFLGDEEDEEIIEEVDKDY